MQVLKQKYSPALGFLALSLVWLGLQIPFLQADPDHYLSESRGPHTDEGLNTCQIRNFVNHGDLTLDKSDNFVKTPLFGVILYIPFKILGTNLLVGRAFVLILSLFICYFAFRRNKLLNQSGLLALSVVFSGYFVFHFFHFSLAEMLSTVLILAGMGRLISGTERTTVIRSAFISALFVSLAYYLKIQFLYAAAITPVAIALLWITDMEMRKHWQRYFAWNSLFLFGFALFYYVAWYLPNQTLFDYVIQNQTDQRFINLSNLYDQWAFVFNYYFLRDYTVVLTYAFFAMWILGAIRFFTKKDRQFNILFVALSAWVLMEVHKTFMTYLPVRYMVSMYFAMGMLVVLVMHAIISDKQSGKINTILRYLTIALIVIIGLQNGKHYIQSIEKRTYAIKEANDYLEKHPLENGTVLGSWAPSLSWKNKALSYPVWGGYFNDTNIRETHQAKLIITEHDEEDANQAFLKDGIHLPEEADSVKTFRIRNWEVKMYWLKD